MIYFKKHSRVYQSRVSTVIAMADCDLIGKKLKSGEACLDLAAYGDFYKGDEVSEKKAGEIFKEHFSANPRGVSFNLVGQQVMKAASKFVDVSKAKKFGKVPHLQVYQV
ncbi:MAG: DUF424 family protein [Candidatus Micrarchaeota archaeon]